MGTTKQRWLESQGLEREAEVISEGLNIPIENLELLDWTIRENRSSDGLLYNYSVIFSENSDEAILDTFSLNTGESYQFESHVFDDELCLLAAEEQEWEAGTTQHYEIFEKSIKCAESVVELDAPEEQQFSLYVMAFLHVMSALEHYIYSVFLHTVTSNDALIKKYVEASPEFEKQKFKLSEIYQTQDCLKDKVTTNIKEFIFHKIHAVKPLYKAVLGYDFGDIEWLVKAVMIRHDCAHRSGYTKEGAQIELSLEDIKRTIAKCKELAYDIDMDTQPF